VFNATKARDNPWLARGIPCRVGEGRTCLTTPSCMAVLGTVKISMQLSGSAVHKCRGPSAVKAYQRQSQKKSIGEKDIFIENLPFHLVLLAEDAAYKRCHV